MKRTIIVALVISLLLVILPVSLALADTTADVTVTATPGSFVGIANSAAVFDFGSITASDIPNTGTGWATITNSSSTQIDITISCTVWSGTTAWTYGTAAEDAAQLKASATFGGGASGGAGLYDVTIPTGTPAALCNDVVVGNSPDWEMQLDAPTSFTHGYEQTTVVTLTAAAG